MPLIDVAALPHLGWDTVKEIVKEDLAERYKSLSLKGGKRIAIDEIHIGSKAKFYTQAIDLESGHKGAPRRTRSERSAGVVNLLRTSGPEDGVLGLQMPDLLPSSSRDK